MNRDIAWGQLRDAYGAADDVPKLLESLTQDTRSKDNYKDEPWFSLWSKLCHQGDVYTASYAAVPIIVHIAQNAEGPINPDFLLLPMCIEIARVNGHGPAIPETLSKSYNAAIAELAHVAESCQPQAKDDPTMRTAIAAATLMSAGKTDEADTLLNSGD
jgi:hypothetical protein